MTMDFRSRTLAALVHACGSVAVAALAAALVFYLWYPWPYTVLAGGTELFVLVCSVDVVIGPLATFAVFDRVKGWPVLRRDLAVILLLQLGALFYGLYVVFEARPVALALEVHRFRVITAVDVVKDELARAPEGLRELPLDGPRVLRTESPTDPAERLAAIEQALAGVDLGQRPVYWRAWDETGRRQALAASSPLEHLRGRYPNRKAELDQAVADTGRGIADLRYVPLLSRHGEWIILIDAASGDVTGFAPFVGD